MQSATSGRGIGPARAGRCRTKRASGRSWTTPPALASRSGQPTPSRRRRPPTGLPPNGYRTRSAAEPPCCRRATSVATTRRTSRATRGQPRNTSTTQRTHRRIATTSCENRRSSAALHSVNGQLVPYPLTSTAPMDWVCVDISLFSSSSSPLVSSLCPPLATRRSDDRRPCHRRPTSRPTAPQTWTIRCNTG